MFFSFFYFFYQRVGESPVPSSKELHSYHRRFLGLARKQHIKKTTSLRRIDFLCCVGQLAIRRPIQMIQIARISSPKNAFYYGVFPLKPNFQNRSVIPARLLAYKILAMFLFLFSLTTFIESLHILTETWITFVLSHKQCRNQLPEVWHLLQAINVV